MRGGGGGEGRETAIRKGTREGGRADDEKVRGGEVLIANTTYDNEE